MANLTAVLEAAGCGWGDVVKSTVFLTDMADFAAMNAIYGRFVTDPQPARSTVAVAGAAQGRPRRDRGHRPTAGLSGGRAEPRLTPRTGRPYDAAPT